MILDSQLSLSRAQSIAAAAGDVISTDIYDTGAAADAGIGQEVFLQIGLNAAVTSGGAATVAFILQTATDSAFTTPVEFPLTPARALSALTANSTQYRGRLPVGLLRFIRVVYRIAAATTTAGTVTTFLTEDIQASPTIATTVPGVK